MLLVGCSSESLPFINGNNNTYLINLYTQVCSKMVTLMNSLGLLCFLWDSWKDAALLLSKSGQHNNDLNFGYMWKPSWIKSGFRYELIFNLSSCFCFLVLKLSVKAWHFVLSGFIFSRAIWKSPVLSNPV